MKRFLEYSLKILLILLRVAEKCIWKPVLAKKAIASIFSCIFLAFASLYLTVVSNSDFLSIAGLSHNIDIVTKKK